MKYKLEDFVESQEYLELVAISDKRKLDLFNDDSQFTYHQLRKRLKKIGNKLEIHHRIPRYRLKEESKSVLNDGSNLMLLTSYEHVLAHYYLTKFEKGRWYYSARMAFIQLTSLKREIISKVNDENIHILLEHIGKCREEYFAYDYYQIKEHEVTDEL